MAGRVLTLHPAHYHHMLAHVQACLPEEACGLLGGRAGASAAVQPVTNALHSPVRFSMEPKEQLQAMLWLEEQGLDLLGIFHSHPTGPDHPSATDVAEFLYPGVLVLIWSPEGAGWQVKAYDILDGQVQAVPLLRCRC